MHDLKIFLLACAETPNFWLLLVLIAMFIKILLTL